MCINTGGSPRVNADGIHGQRIYYIYIYIYIYYVEHQRISLYRLCTKQINKHEIHIKHQGRVAAGMHLHTHRPGWRADRQCMLGTVLPGTRHPAGRNVGHQPGRRTSGQSGQAGSGVWLRGRVWRRRSLQHVLQRVWGRQVRASGGLHRPRADSYR